MVKLEIHDFQWVNGPVDDPDDQCAHGRVRFEINGTSFVKPDDGLWTVSASGLYLLRSLSEDHTHENQITEGNLLFPCCGFNVWPVGVRFKVLCMGCPKGVDVEVIHSVDSVTVRSPAGVETLPFSAWRDAVVAFTSSVKEFYQASTPKTSIQDELDRQGWVAFWQEWDERYAIATTPFA